MKIGIDYGGVIHYDPEGWIVTIKNLIKARHEVFIVSHCLADGKDHLTREYLCEKSGAINLTFYDIMDEPGIRIRKSDLVKAHGIELFIDDSPERCWVVRENNKDCGILHFKEWNWGQCKFVLDCIGNARIE